MATAWYDYPIDTPGGSYGQITDPLANRSNPYLKPDVNIQVPGGTPITAIQSGIVTDVSDHGGGGGGLSVVIASDNPINSLATHVAYNYLGGSDVQVGQRVNAGTQIATAGSPYGIPMAVALTSDRVWGNGTFNLNAQGNPQLDPHLLLNPLRAGQALPQGGTANLAAQGSGVPLIGPLIDWLNQFLGQFQGVLDWFTNPTRIIKLVLGMILVGISTAMLVIPDVSKYAGKYGKYFVA